MKKILAVTGITGKSGSVFAEELLKDINNVNKLFPDGIRFLKRNNSKFDNDKYQKLNCQILIGDLEDINFLSNSFENVDTVLHIAGIHWSKKVADAAINNNVRRLILVHTTGIYSKYKAAGEEYRQIDSYIYQKCKNNGTLLTILRPTMIYGTIKDRNIVTFIKMVDRLPIMPVIEQANYELQPVFYKDLGKAYYLVLVNENNTANKDFILSGGKAISLREILKIIGLELNKKVRFLSFPFWFGYACAWLLFFITLGCVDYREKVQRLCEPRVYSHEDAKNAFDYKPINFEEGIKYEIAAYKESYK